MDTKCNFPIDENKRQEFYGTNENTVNGDESLLRQPLRTSLAGFREAKRAYENGTDEVRRLLMQECSIIYECNVCRNMFRSLANFISHKRIYCKEAAESNSYNSYSGHNSSVIIQTIEHPEAWFNKSRSTGSSPVPTTAKASNRDLSKVIERLKRVDVSSEPKKVPQQVKTQPPSPATVVSDPVLQLERVPTTTQAVYQTLTTTQNTCDSIKTELDEVHNLLTNQKTMLGADGKAIINHSFMTGPAASTTTQSNELSLVDGSSNYKNINALNVACEICKMPFQTEKTLKLHVQKKHTSSTYVFQCPTCSLTFLQPAAVIRHLANEHKKPLRRIRKMRDTILKKRIQIGDVQVKGPSREVKRLKLDDTNDLDDNMLQQQSGKPISTCTYCKKNFERRAALSTHLNSCPARKYSSNSVEMSTKSSSSHAKEDTKQTKIHKQIDTNQHLEPNQNLKNEIKKIEQNETVVNIKQEPQDELNSTTTATSINQMFENLEKQTFGNGLQTVSLDKLDIMVEKKEREDKDIVQQVENNDNNMDHDKQTKDAAASMDEKKKPKRFRIVPASKQLACRCKICNKQFNALSNLRRHISMFHYRSRRFGCNLCDYRAFRRYDIVNHLLFVHKMSGERETMAVEHVTVHDIKYSKDDVEGDIVVVNELSNEEQHPLQLPQESTLKTYEKRGKRKKVLLSSNKEQERVQQTTDATSSAEIPHIKVVRKKLKKALSQQVESHEQKRPIRNRVKTVNNDFVYDLPTTLKEEPKEPTRLVLKRRNTIFFEHKNSMNIELTPPPIKITPYRLRTEPLIPASKEVIKGFAATVYRNVIHEALAAPSTLPDLPTERPQMRSRLISASRNDSNTVPIIDTSELEAAGLKSTLFDDSFLEKFAKKSNPSFRMKPLLALQHSPFNSILQKFDATLHNSTHKNVQAEETTKPEEYSFLRPLEKCNTSPPSSTECIVSPLLEQSLQEVDVTPNGKHVLEPLSPPSAPKKRITLMQRLAENRARQRDSLLRNALEN